MGKRESKRTHCCRPADPGVVPSPHSEARTAFALSTGTKMAPGSLLPCMPASSESKSSADPDPPPPANPLSSDSKSTLRLSRGVDSPAMPPICDAMLMSCW